mmetsp:Transcript_57484/g.132011  ORF Transcript_57484/g.132011 Transcript_57484/m.132011 type:complete len:236 (+) Transcript_57484:6-713(+)
MHPLSVSIHLCGSSTLGTRMLATVAGPAARNTQAALTLVGQQEAALQAKKQELAQAQERVQALRSEVTTLEQALAKSRSDLRSLQASSSPERQSPHLHSAGSADGDGACNELTRTARRTRTAVAVYSVDGRIPSDSATGKRKATRARKKPKPVTPPHRSTSSCKTHSRRVSFSSSSSKRSSEPSVRRFAGRVVTRQEWSRRATQARQKRRRRRGKASLEFPPRGRSCRPRCAPPR